MAGVANRTNVTGGAGGPTTTLFLVVDESTAGDAAVLGAILERLGFLADGELGERVRLPVAVASTGVPVTVDAGPGVARLLEEELAGAPATVIGLDGVPSHASRTILSFSVDGSVPVSRSEVAHNIAFIASSVAAMTGGIAIFWPPARLWSASNDLAGAVIAMQANALPPVLHFVAFAASEAPPRRTIATQGLSWFVGQELLVVGTADQVDATQLMRRAGRLSIDAMMNGPFADNSMVAGLEPGESITFRRLGQSDDHHVVEAEILCGPAHDRQR